LIRQGSLRVQFREGLPLWVRRHTGVPVPGRVTRATLAWYPVAVRRVRDFVISFLQIPPRDGHPCLGGWFRSFRSKRGVAPP